MLLGALALPGGIDPCCVVPACRFPLVHSSAQLVTQPLSRFQSASDHATEKLANASSKPGGAQVCHDDRVVELKEQLEVEEEDGDREEEEVEVESGEASQRDAPMNMTVGDNVIALRT